MIKYAVEQKRKELIQLLSSKYKGLSDGRTLHELTLQELQMVFREGEKA